MMKLNIEQTNHLEREKNGGNLLFFPGRCDVEGFGPFGRIDAVVPGNFLTQALT